MQEVTLSLEKDRDLFYNLAEWYDLDEMYAAALDEVDGDLVALKVLAHTLAVHRELAAFNGGWAVAKGDPGRAHDQLKALAEKIPELVEDARHEADLGRKHTA